MRCILKILIAVVMALAVVILLSVIHHYRLRNAVNDYIARLKARGEPMELAQVLPPQIPKGQDGADILRQAAALIDADDSLSYSNYIYGMEMVAPGKAIICWRQRDIRNVYGTNSWKQVEAAAVQNKKSFLLLHQLISRPHFDLHVSYNSGVAGLEFTNLYLAPSKEASLRLETAALCDLRNGETASAVENLRTMLALVKAMRNERLVISELVRIAIANSALAVNWEILQSPNVTDEQLAQLETEWRGMNFTSGDENALEMERVLGEITLAKWRSSSGDLQRYLESGQRAQESIGISSEDRNVWNRMDVRAKLFMWRYWWSYPDELRALKGYETLLTSARLAQTNQSFQTALRWQESQLAALGIDKLDNEPANFLNPKKIDLHSLLSPSIITLSGFLDHVLRAKTAEEMVVTAIALKRYHLRHGNYPDRLNLLVPAFVTTLPFDPVNGRPLHYRRNADGTFLLYSVGENGRDDGGNAALENDAESSNFYWLDSRALDWVWPRPATAQEIQHYHDRVKSKD